MKFVGAILSNNSTEDHCKEFVALGGLKYIVKLLSLPNLPADYAVTPAAQAVANVCKSILVSIYRNSLNFSLLFFFIIN